MNQDIPSPTTINRPISCPALLNHTFAKLQDGSPQSLCQYAGQVILVVNTASACGYTQQYADLEKLYNRYKAKGFVVLGFPSNDFQQETGSNQEVASFCTNTYGIQFPMFEKSHVSGNQASAFYKDLKMAAKQEPRWNFYKFLIDRHGAAVDVYPSQTSPFDPELVQEIEKQLASAGP